MVLIKPWHNARLEKCLTEDIAGGSCWEVRLLGGFG